MDHRHLECQPALALVADRHVTAQVLYITDSCSRPMKARTGRDGAGSLLSETSRLLKPGNNNADKEDGRLGST